MSSRSSGPAGRQVIVALCLIAATFLVAISCAATASASNYKMVLCAANNGSNGFQTATNTTSPQNPGGIFSFENYCGPAGDPAGDAAFLRIAENQGSGSAGQSAYGSISWTVPPWVALAAAGGYTREPGSFNDGWRGRFWLEGWDGSTNNVLMQGSGVDNGSCGGVCWATTPVFASHLWPFGGLGDYRRFVFELTCMRPAGCDRSGWNAVDANTMVLILNDVSPVDLHLTNTGSPLMSGQWVRGTQSAYYVWSDQGSGIRMEWIDIDGARKFTIDHAGECNIGYSQTNGEFARDFQPCATASNIGRSYTFDTAALSDGTHTLRACAQDYGQYVGLFGSGGASCGQGTIRTDNSAPGAPAGLEVRSANPARYMRNVTLRWQLPPNQGSPIRAVHYEVVDGAGKVVQPERTVAVSEPSEISLTGPEKAGDYRARVWLEDSVGFKGALATVAIPRDTTPPAAPQGLTAIGPESWGSARYRLRWQNAPDSGSPIVAARYQLLDAAGQALGAAKTVTGEGVQGVPELTAPSDRRNYSARVWLEDEEHNVGAAATVSLPRDGTPPASPQDLSVAAPDSSRSADGFDLRWRNVSDDGSPIVAAHYQVLDRSGSVVVPTQTETGNDVQSIANLKAPTVAGSYSVRLWLEDSEGNAGAPTTAPLSYDCVRSDVGGGSGLAIGFGSGVGHAVTVDQGQGALLTGQLQGVEREGASVCLWSRVVTDQGRDFLGLAIADANGRFQFAVAAGPSRELIAAYRPDHRRIQATAEIGTVVHPTLRSGSKVVRTGEYGHFEGEIPGPHNDNVTVVMQVRSGKGWLAFRRYRTRNDGHYELSYLFRRTSRPVNYEMRVQVREPGGYPYLEGDSDPLVLRVVPKSTKNTKVAPMRDRCPRKRAEAKGRRGKRCAQSRAGKAGAER